MGVGVLAPSVLTLFTPVAANLSVWALVAVRVLEGLFEVREVHVYIRTVCYMHANISGIHVPSDAVNVGEMGPSPRTEQTSPNLLLRCASMGGRGRGGEGGRGGGGWRVRRGRESEEFRGIVT